MPTPQPRGAKKQLGGRGEQIASEYLQSLGLEVVARNWRMGHYELDLVARKGDRAHVVEVKTRRGSERVVAEELLKHGQARRLVAAADVYAKRYAWVQEVEIDLLVILFHDGAYSLEYYPDAVLPNF